MSLERIGVFIAVALPAFIVVAYALVDVIAAKRLSAGRKALWVGVIVFTAHVGVLLYFLVRPLAESRKASRQGGSERSAALLDLLERHDRGQIDDFVARKQALFTRAGTT